MKMMEWRAGHGGIIPAGPAHDPFLMNSCCKDERTGRMYFGGVKGFAEFHPDSVKTNTFEPPVAILSMYKYTEGAGISEFNTIGKKEVSLSFQDQLATFRFAALDFHNPPENEYQYKLEGLYEEWISLGTRNEITFSKLDPGHYTLRIRGGNDEGRFSDHEAELDIFIAPPWYRSWGAYGMWAFLLAGRLFMLYRFQLNRKLAQAEAQRLKELDAVKTRLYTNITHEFRTPLTVILGMAGQVAGNPREWLGEGMQLIKQYGRQLLLLVNQMLDLAKLESGSLPVNKVQGDIVKYLQYLAESFQSYAESKDISLHFLTDRDTQSFPLIIKPLCGSVSSLPARPRLAAGRSAYSVSKKCPAV
ncbi:MAG: hypothetical protein H6558_08460 [Lewinellaceae bacterium]|nr:hypothetical protein [Lewinellaceae bacterium]